VLGPRDVKDGEKATNAAELERLFKAAGAQALLSGEVIAFDAYSWRDVYVEGYYDDFYYDNFYWRRHGYWGRPYPYYYPGPAYYSVDYAQAHVSIRAALKRASNGEVLYASPAPIEIAAYSQQESREGVLAQATSRPSGRSCGRSPSCP